ncbi:MAG: transcriptional regulator [Candidatus Dadabacteria bacterium RBG_19FT_COMBO_40_33]|nr:MAG: transcriptional regulator [Candidatus Dadabacteria bacterium RBG_19FT_COMBO_40_33]HJZ05572.1 metal-sensitive transcriptional regulator [Patescibacteria group bacterium]
MKDKDKIIKRLKSIEGHIRGIQRMIEEDKYCIDVIKQALAVKSAVDKVNALILESHLKSCVTTAIRSSKLVERERVIAELLDVFETSGKI